MPISSAIFSPTFSRINAFNSNSKYTSHSFHIPTNTFPYQSTLQYFFDIFNYRQHLGGYYNMELAEEDGQVYLTINTREETTVYLCKPSDLEKVKELMLKYALPAASKKPMSDIQALDGDITSLSFRFEDYKNFSVSSSQNLSAENRNGMSEIYSYLQSLITGEPYYQA